MVDYFSSSTVATYDVCFMILDGGEYFVLL